MASVDVIARGLGAKGLQEANRANDRIDHMPQIDGMQYLGAVSYYKDLPDGAQKGDVYTVKYTGTSGSTPDGSEYVWGTYDNTDQWIKIGKDYESLTPVEGGTDVSLVTTGEKYIWNNKQDELENQVNIKSVNGNSLLGSGNLAITTYQPFPSAWPVDSAHTTKQFCDAIDADTTAVIGMGYFGGAQWSDKPEGLSNGDVVVEILEGPNSSKAIHLIMTSSSVSPYRWEYTYWSHGSTSPWRGVQPEITSNNKLSSSLVSGLASVATSGSYNDLSDQPTIPTVPTNVSAFNNDAGYITNSDLSGYATETWVGNQGYLTSVSWNDVASKPNFATVATSGSYDDLIDKPTIPTNTNQTVKTSSVTFGADDVVEIVAGSNVTVTGNASAKTITIAATGGSSSSIPDCPTTTDGTFILQCVVSGGVATYSWLDLDGGDIMTVVPPSQNGSND